MDSRATTIVQASDLPPSPAVMLGASLNQTYGLVVTARSVAQLAFHTSSVNEQLLSDVRLIVRWVDAEQILDMRYSVVLEVRERIHV